MPLSRNSWRATGTVLALSATIYMPLGFGSGFLQANPVTDMSLVLKGCCISLFSPSLLEELAFRAALLPHPAVDGHISPSRFALSAVLPLALFISYHLINPRAESRKVFMDWRFLALAGVLGVSCSAAYYVTNGSLLAAVVSHWIPVNVWLFAFGGYQKLKYAGVA